MCLFCTAMGYGLEPWESHFHQRVKPAEYVSSFTLRLCDLPMPYNPAKNPESPHNVGPGHDPWNASSSAIHTGHPMNGASCFTERPWKDRNICSFQLKAQILQNLPKSHFAFTLKSSIGDFDQANTWANSVLTTTLGSKFVCR